MAFQFPTGWNSTIDALAEELRSEVSIPNGMEFYKKGDEMSETMERFNSQRDGILRSRYWCCFWRFGVSIPNGMEFYEPKILLSRELIRFQFPTGWNSTLACRSCRRECFVSIPNGMEFYNPYTSFWADSSYVSIPNGMEFYGKQGLELR